MRVGALTLWALAAVLWIVGLMTAHWRLPDLAMLPAFGAFALDVRRLTIVGVRQTIRAMSLWNDDVPGDGGMHRRL